MTLKREVKSTDPHAMFWRRIWWTGVLLTALATIDVPTIVDAVNHAGRPTTASTPFTVTPPADVSTHCVGRYTFDGHRCLNGHVLPRYYDLDYCITFSDGTRVLREHCYGGDGQPWVELPIDALHGFQ